MKIAETIQNCSHVKTFRNPSICWNFKFWQPKNFWN